MDTSFKHDFNATWIELEREELEPEEPLQECLRILYDDTARPGVRHTRVVGCVSVHQHGRPPETITGDIHTTHDVDAPSRDRENHQRVVRWMVKRVAHDVMKAMLGAAYVHTEQQH